MKSILWGIVASLFLAAMFFTGNFPVAILATVTITVVMSIFTVFSVILSGHKNSVKEFQNTINGLAGTINDLRTEIINKNTFISVLENRIVNLEKTLLERDSELKSNLKYIEDLKLIIRNLEYPLFKVTSDPASLQKRFFFKVHQGKNTLWYLSIIGPEGKYRFSSKGYKSYVILFEDFEAITKAWRNMTIFDPHMAIGKETYQVS